MPFSIKTKLKFTRRESILINPFKIDSFIYRKTFGYEVFLSELYCRDIEYYEGVSLLV